MTLNKNCGYYSKVLNKCYLKGFFSLLLSLMRNAVPLSLIILNLKYLFNLIYFDMLQIVKAKVNGKDGFICTVVVNGQPSNVVFTDKKDVLSLLDNL